MAMTLALSDSEASVSDLSSYHQALLEGIKSHLAGRSLSFLSTVVHDQNFISNCHKDSKNIESLRKSFCDIYNVYQEHQNLIEEVRKLFSNLVMETTKVPLSELRSLAQPEFFSPSQMALREFDERTSLHTTAHSTLFVNLKIHNFLAESYERGSPESYPILLELFDYFVDENYLAVANDEDETFLEEVRGIKNTLSALCRNSSRNPKRQRVDVLSDPFDVYTKAKEVESDGNSSDDYKSLYLDSYIAGFDKAFLDIRPSA